MGNCCSEKDPISDFEKRHVPCEGASHAEAEGGVFQRQQREQGSWAGMNLEHLKRGEKANVVGKG